ncbi:MAG: Holliday junction resolvase RuvX [Chloroflexi bacterium]|nr:Holliday junction resolvase RuvX [Chloroflexota bacterium]
MSSDRRYLGLDVGEKRIGVAISSPGGVMALPLKTLEFSEPQEAVAAIAEIVRQQDIGRIVVGLPRSLSGEVGPQAVKVQEFAGLLSRATAVPIEFQDERFSTSSVERMMREAGARREKRRERRDAEAAAYILQGYLDGLPGNEDKPELESNIKNQNEK